MGDEEALNRPSIGFPLGLGLLVILLVCTSAFFACCLRWEKLRSLLQSSDQDFNSDIEADISQSPRKPVPPHKISNQGETQSLTVLMPGDQVPKFIAVACPCRPPVYAKSKN